MATTWTPTPLIPNGGQLGAAATVLLPDGRLFCGTGYGGYIYTPDDNGDYRFGTWSDFKPHLDGNYQNGAMVSVHHNGEVSFMGGHPQFNDTGAYTTNVFDCRLNQFTRALQEPGPDIDRRSDHSNGGGHVWWDPGLNRIGRAADGAFVYYDELTNQVIRTALTGPSTAPVTESSGDQLPDGRGYLISCEKPGSTTMRGRLLSTGRYDDDVTWSRPTITHSRSWVHDMQRDFDGTTNIGPHHANPVNAHTQANNGNFREVGGAIWMPKIGRVVMVGGDLSLWLFNPASTAAPVVSTVVPSDPFQYGPAENTETMTLHSTHNGQTVAQLLAGSTIRLSASPASRPITLTGGAWAVAIQTTNGRWFTVSGTGLSVDGVQYTTTNVPAGNVIILNGPLRHEAGTTTGSIATGGKVTSIWPYPVSIESWVAILPDGRLMTPMQHQFAFGSILCPNYSNVALWDGTSWSVESGAGNGASNTTTAAILPSGQVAMANGNGLMIRTTDDAPDTTARPTITNAPASVVPGSRVVIAGTQLHGLHHGYQFNDEFSSWCNHPIGRLTSKGDGRVYYCATRDWSTRLTSVNLASTASLEIPSSIPPGDYTLQIASAGNISQARDISVAKPSGGVFFNWNGASLHTPATLVMSTSENRTGNVALNGRTVAGLVAIQAIPATGAGVADTERFRWFFDPVDPNNLPPELDEEGDDTFVRGDRTAPYDLLGGTLVANMWDTTKDPKPTGTRATEGTRKIVAEQIFADGVRVKIEATITIDNVPAVVVPPATPVGSAVATPSNGVVRLSWANGGTAGGATPTTEYEYQVDTVNPPASAEVSRTTTSVDVTVTPGTTYYCRVRALNASGVESPWSSVLTVTATGTPPTRPPAGRVAGGLTTDTVATVGGTGPRWLAWTFRKGVNVGVTATINQAAVPKAVKEGNCEKVAPLLGFLDNAAEEAVNIWNNKTATFGNHSANVGPWSMVNIPIVFVGEDAVTEKPLTPNSRPRELSNGTFVTTKSSNSYKSMLALVDTALGVWNADYKEMAKRIRLATHGGLTNHPSRTYVRLGHEHNGAWYPWCSGIDPSIPAYYNSLNTSNKNALRARFGTIPTAIIDAVLLDGNRGPLFAQAWRTVVTTMRNEADGLMFDWNVSHPGASPDGEGGDGLLRTWNLDAYPGYQYVDIVSLDIYGRGSGKTDRGFTDTVISTLADHVALAAYVNRPLGFGEVGVARNKVGIDPDTITAENPTGSNYAGECTDLVTSRWWTQWHQYLKGERVVNPINNSTLIEANAIKGRNAAGAFLPSRTVSGVTLPAITEDVKFAYWMYWNSAGENNDGRKYRFTYDPTNDPLTMAALRSIYNVGPYAPAP